MDNNCKTILREILAEIRDKPNYIVNIDLNSEMSMELSYYEGMLQAYFFVMEGILDYINCSENLTLDDVGLADYDPLTIFDNLPKR